MVSGRGRRRVVATCIVYLYVCRGIVCVECVEWKMALEVLAKHRALGGVQWVMAGFANEGGRGELKAERQTVFVVISSS